MSHHITHNVTGLLNDVLVLQFYLILSFSPETLLVDNFVNTNFAPHGGLTTFQASVDCVAEFLDTYLLSTNISSDPKDRRPKQSRVRYSSTYLPILLLLLLLAAAAGMAPACITPLSLPTASAVSHPSPPPAATSPATLLPTPLPSRALAATEPPRQR